jgi:hypothetical protein
MEFHNAITLSFFFFAFFNFKLSILSLRFFKFFQTSHTFRRRWRQCKRVRCRGLGIGVATMDVGSLSKQNCSVFRLRKVFPASGGKEKKVRRVHLHKFSMCHLVEGHCGSSDPGEGGHLQVPP